MIVPWLPPETGLIVRGVETVLLEDAEIVAVVVEFTGVVFTGNVIVV